MIKRIQEKRLLEMLDRFPVVAVIGPRQVGKSTLVRSDSVNSGRSYFTLDDFDTLGLAEKDPRALLSSGKTVTLDEVQRCPELLRFIKAEVDRNRSSGHFLITGSSDLNFTANLARELAGRVGILPLPPLSWRELEGRLAPPVWLSWLDAKSISDMEASSRLITPKVTDIEALFSGGYPLAVTVLVLPGWGIYGRIFYISYRCSKCRAGFSLGSEMGKRQLIQQKIEESVRVKQQFSDKLLSDRSEERRVGKECRSRWSPYH